MTRTLLAILLAFRRLRCPHSRTFSFCPDDVHWYRDGEAQGRLSHGAKVTACMDCGAVWGENYAE